jgi:hypothetical protein
MNSVQRSCESKWAHGTPAGLPWGMPGRGEWMDGAMQQAAQPGRQFMAEAAGEGKVGQGLSDSQLSLMRSDR